MTKHAKSLLVVLLIASALFALRFCHPHSGSYPSLTKAAQPPFEVGTAQWGDPMGIESLTYAELGDRFGVSPVAVRSLARRLRLPRRPGNDGKVRITIDLAEIQYKPLPARTANNHPSNVSYLNARVEQLEGELARLEVEKQCLEVQAVGHRTDFEYERERSDTLLTETLKLGQLAMSAREKAARLEGMVSAALGTPSLVEAACCPNIPACRALGFAEAEPRACRCTRSNLTATTVATP
jgi:hypothetical protein